MEETILSVSGQNTNNCLADWPMTSKRDAVIVITMTICQIWMDIRALWSKCFVRRTERALLISPTQCPLGKEGLHVHVYDLCFVSAR